MITFKRPNAQESKQIDPLSRKSAVLALLYPKFGKLHTVLMLRNVYNGTHSGQVSFPGGKYEDQDDSLWHTALREANEEVGVAPSDIIPIGALTDVYIPPSRFLVTPYLAYSKQAPTFIADPTEVQKIIETPVSVFLDSQMIKHKKIKIASSDIHMKIKYYDVEGETVWGATAMMLSELAEILKSINIPLNTSY